MRLFRYTSIAVLVAAIGLVGCGGKKMVDPDPAQLPDLPKQQEVWKKQWSVSVGDGLGGEFLRLSPAITSSGIYAASRDGVLVAVNRENGDVLWRQKTGLTITGGVSAAYGMVVVGTAKGQVYAFNAQNGEKLWQSGFSAAVLSRVGIDADAVVVQTADGKIFGLNREDGTRIWTHESSVPALSIRGTSSPLMNNGAAFVGTASGRIEALESRTGASGWSTLVSTNSGRSELERIVDVDGELLLSGNTLYSAGYQSQLTAVNAQNGRRLWQFEVSSAHGLAEGMDNIYVVDTTSTLYAVDSKSGKAVWKQPDLTWRSLTSPATSLNSVLVGDRFGYVHIMAQSDGRMLGRFKSSGEPVVALNVESDTAFVYGAKGHLSAWRLTQN